MNPTKSPRNLILVLTCLGALFFTSALCAADAATPSESSAKAPAGVTAENVVQWLTPLLVPLIITGIKKVAPSIPTWMIPALAPALGVLLDIINSYATHNSPNLLVASLLGLAGVGVREIKTNIIRPKDEIDAPFPPIKST